MQRVLGKIIITPILMMGFASGLPGLFVFPQMIHAKGLSEKSPGGELKGLEAVLLRYRKSSAIRSKINRKTYQALTEKELAASGEMLLSKGRLRLEMSPPDRSLAIFDKTQLTLVSYLPEEFGGKAQVTRMKADKLGRAASWMGVMFGRQNLHKEFRLGELRKLSDQQDEYILIPNSPEATELVKLSVRVDRSKNEIARVTVWDELENKTDYEFSNTAFGVKFKKDAFQYTPPKDAEVMDL